MGKITFVGSASFVYISLLRTRREKLVKTYYTVVNFGRLCPCTLSISDRRYKYMNNNMFRVVLKSQNHKNTLFRHPPGPNFMPNNV